jgi:hypothetical protein
MASSNTFAVGIQLQFQTLELICFTVGTFTTLRFTSLTIVNMVIDSIPYLGAVESHRVAK